ncbi:MAG TPA: adenine deaminase [Bacteroidales bacterium]|nr:MAG: adenine deaminase [Bacteroidetes bacterium GWE2_42_24]OFY25962.1 MAG: adenine deaminase [Bacteroidetes bacterium GWF2_43_11]HBZ66629.1 adenine deaminase [Bacteroidales bacterium]
MNLQKQFTLSGQIIDVVRQRVFSGYIEVDNGRIRRIREKSVADNRYILPGFVDAHVHIESSMLPPSEFGRVAAVHGTVACVSDPHEIANVLGVQGVQYMIDDGKRVPFKFYFGAPSCVPATSFETSGAVVTPADVERLLRQKEIRFLSEMMNYPGVLQHDEQVMRKLEAARRNKKPVDGHAPGLRGADAEAYCRAGITTDHECETMEEAIDKLRAGMSILIREGSAAKNFDALVRLIADYPSHVMLCSDDKHPDDLLKGHINELVVRALSAGIDIFKVLRACTYNPVKHYDLDTGLLQPGDPADFIVVNNLAEFKVLETYINGIKVAEGGHSVCHAMNTETPNHFKATEVNRAHFNIPASGRHVRVIQAIDGHITTECFIGHPLIVDGCAVSDTENDILKIAVINRYKARSRPTVGFIRGFGLKSGALASTVAHDSHNIIVVGADDDDMCAAVNAIVANKGGIAAAHGNEVFILPLPIAGLMSTLDAQTVARRYELMDRLARGWGAELKAPFMTLSFMALLVIPKLKISDKGLFDSKQFEFTSLFVEI